MNKLAAEFMGTFCLVFAGAGAIVVNQVTGGVIGHAGIAITFGLVVMAMIQTFGDVSGAHLNPAVTVAFAASGRFAWGRVPGYVLVQVAGALAAAGLLRALFPENLANGGSLGATHAVGAVWRSLVLEALLTGGLMLVILHVATGSKEKGLLAGITIGGVVALEAMFAGPICGASMNPARSIGPAVVSGQVGDVWVYVLGPVVGAVGAIGVGAVTMNRGAE